MILACGNFRQKPLTEEAKCCNAHLPHAAAGFDWCFVQERGRMEDYQILRTEKSVKVGATLVSLKRQILSVFYLFS